MLREKYIFQNNKNNLVYKVMNRSYSDDYLKGFSTIKLFHIQDIIKKSVLKLIFFII